MEYNLLDRLYDEENYGPNSAEFLLRGLSRKGQEKLIKDFARKTAFNRAIESSKYDFYSAKNYANELENRVRQMPENLQDAFLRTVGFNDNVNFNNDLEGFFRPDTKETFLGYYLGPHAYIHERGGHETMNRLKSGKDRYIPAGFYTESELIPHPDASVEENLAEAFHKDYGNRFEHGGEKWDNKSLYDTLSDDIRSMPGFKNLSESDRDRVSRNIIDNIGMDYRVKGLENFGHDYDYQTGLKYNTESFIGKSDFIDAEKANNAALSSESAAHMAEMLSTPNSDEFVNKNFPEYRKKFLSIIDRDKDSPTPESFIESHGKIAEDYKEDGNPIENYRYFAFDNYGYPVGFRSKRKMLEFNDTESEIGARKHYEEHFSNKSPSRLSISDPKTEKKIKFFKWYKQSHRPMFYVDKNNRMKRIIKEYPDDFEE